MNIIKYKHFFHTFTFITLLALFTIACEKPEKIPPAPETGTVTDQQGRVYKTV